MQVQRFVGDGNAWIDENTLFHDRTAVSVSMDTDWNRSVTNIKDN